MTEEEVFLNSLCLGLRKLRTDRGITLEHTEELGWKRWKHLQRIETRASDVRIITLFRVSKLYQKKMSVILDGIGY